MWFSRKTSFVCKRNCKADDTIMMSNIFGETSTSHLFGTQEYSSSVTQPSYISWQTCDQRLSFMPYPEKSNIGADQNSLSSYNFMAYNWDFENFAKNDYLLSNPTTFGANFPRFSFSAPMISDFGYGNNLNYQQWNNFGSVPFQFKDRNSECLNEQKKIYWDITMLKRNKLAKWVGNFPKFSKLCFNSLCFLGQLLSRFAHLLLIWVALYAVTGLIATTTGFLHAKVAKVSSKDLSRETKTTSAVMKVTALLTKTEGIDVNIVDLRNVWLLAWRRKL